MPHVTVARMREADRRCIKELGIPGAVLMHNAGAAVFAEVTKRFPRPAAMTVVCGKGNNGGDGWVVARLAMLSGWDVTVLSTAPPASLAGDAGTFARVGLKLGLVPVVVTSEEDAVDALAGVTRDSRVIVDALLGTGTEGEVRGLPRILIDAWPARIPTVAVDVPSGLNADTGEPCGAAVRAGVTVTFGFAKVGLVRPEARPWVGDLVVADIGIPAVCADDTAWAELRQRWTSP
ncbi:MAG TPA: NAD(P)H-hydrate epimerase [Candidatus Hydrogenedentes bacterium]|nr:NAD(P)H-hydrate epimerase [Candidatus Hydrogenedentota bacterium]